MNFDLRKAVMANLDDSNYDEIRETIIDAIESGEEKTLPGLVPAGTTQGDCLFQRFSYPE